MKKQVLSTLLAVTLAASMTVFVSCDLNKDEQAKALIGTWVGEGEELTFSDGSFEMREEGTPQIKGTYTVSGNTLTMTATHMWGSLFEDFGLETKWYSKAEIKTIIKQALEFTGQQWTADVDKAFEEEFTQKCTFAVNGNTLTITQEGSSSGSTYTRK